MSKYPRTYHLSISPGCTSDDKISENVDSLLNRRIIITEKLDGENNSLVTNGVMTRSHVEFTKNHWTTKTWELWERIRRSISEEMFLFGENMYGVHSIEYHELQSYFYLFGVRELNRWYSWKEIEEISYLLDIPTVPVLFDVVFKTKKELHEKVLELVKQPSRLGSKIMEGCVIRIYDSFTDDDFSTVVQKWVRKDHVQTDQHWTRNWKKAKIKYQ